MCISRCEHVEFFIRKMLSYESSHILELYSCKQNRFASKHKC